MGVGRSTDTSVSPVASDFGFVITREFYAATEALAIGRGGNYFSSEGDLSREGVMRPSLFHFGYQTEVLASFLESLLPLRPGRLRY